MSNVSIYKFENTAEIRVVEIEGNPWFVAKDALAGMGYPQTSHANILKKLADDEVILKQIQKGVRSVSLISESGVYKLVMRSDKPEAQRFQDWITRDVLPAIRKDGAYIMGEEKVATGEMDEEAFILEAYEMLKRKVERLAQKKEQLTTERDGLSSVVGQHRHTLARFARTLPGINVNSVKRELHRLGYLYRTVGTNNGGTPSPGTSCPVRSCAQETRPVTLEEAPRASMQKEKRIIDVLEPVMNQHRLVIDKALVKKDYDSAPDPKYSLFYQLTRITKDKGALIHDDRPDALAGAVAYWVEQMGRDTDKAAQSHRERLLTQELGRFRRSAFGIELPQPGWINL